MLKLSKKTEYALMAARFMALNNHGSFVTAKEISEHYDISFELVAKVLQNLVKHKIAVSSQGIKGGYTLTKNPFNISLIELVMAVEPKIQLTNCSKPNATKNDCSHLEVCKIRDPLIEVQNRIHQVFAETKLSDLL